jgi:hypothetical protein
MMRIAVVTPIRLFSEGLTELDGSADYLARVRYRLVPMVW